MIQDKIKENITKDKWVFKLISFLILILIFVNISISSFAFSIGENIVAKEGTKVPTLMKFGDMYILCSLAEVYKDGNKYYAYCLEAPKNGVEVLGDYNLTISKKVTDNKIYSVLLHGYPNKSPSELGVKNAGEAFLATKQAIYTLIYDRDVNQYSGLDTDAGRRTYAAYKQIVSNAKKYPYKEIKAEISIEEISDWILSDNNIFVEKEFKVSTNTTSGKYNLFLKNNNINAKLVINNDIAEKDNMNNLNLKDEIKLRINVEDLEDCGELKLEVSSKTETSIVYEAKPEISTAQKLAIVGVKEVKDILNNTDVGYFRNETKLEIMKVDEDDLPLSYVVFNIYNSNNELIYENVRTDKDGKLIIENLLPGKYIIKEIATKPGYILTDEEIEVDVEFNETTEMKIKNEKEKIPEKPKKVLPQTGY